jgi:hypothetical protein
VMTPWMSASAEGRRDSSPLVVVPGFGSAQAERTRQTKARETASSASRPRAFSILLTPTPTSFVEVTPNNRRYGKDRVYMVGAARHSYLLVVQQKEGSCWWKYPLL